MITNFDFFNFESCKINLFKLDLSLNRAFFNNPFKDFDAKMPKNKYRFDPKTLTFEKHKLPVREKLKRIGAFIIVTTSVAIGGNVLYNHFYDTPKVEALEREKQELLSSYQLLNTRIDKYRYMLSEIEHRDDHLYRPIFELDPVSQNVREAGYGGVDYYEEFKGFKSSEVIINTYQKLDRLSRKVYVQSKSFDTVIEMAKNMEKMIACVPAIQPIAIKDMTRISDYYGTRNDPFTGKPTMHNGMDFTGDIGAEIYATGDGKVIEAGYNLYGYGNRVIVDHGFGFKTIYAHLNKVDVQPGDRVKRGEVIGELGNTGRSTGPHLHYEIRKNNKPVNPIRYYFNDITAEEYDLMVELSAKRRTPMD